MIVTPLTMLCTKQPKFSGSIVTYRLNLLTGLKIGDLSHYVDDLRLSPFELIFHESLQVALMNQPIFVQENV